MLVARFLDGLAGSAFLSVAGGTVGDMFGKHVSRYCVSQRFISDVSLGAICAYDGLHSQSIRRSRSWPSDRRFHR